jgi:hypothetical protein
MWTGERAAVYIDLPFWNRPFLGPKVLGKSSLRVWRRSPEESLIWEPFTLQENLSLPEFIGGWWKFHGKDGAIDKEEGAGAGIAVGEWLAPGHELYRPAARVGPATAL